jgi:hypothetical protein
MTLRDLLNKCSYKKTFNQIYKVYLKGKRSQDDIIKIDSAYCSFFENLKKLPKAKPSVDKIRLAPTSDPEIIIDVCFFDQNENQLYALDFIDWGEIIDLEVERAFKLSDEECLAHVLHEISFWGFDQKTFDEQKKLLRDQNSRVSNK